MSKKLSLDQVTQLQLNQTISRRIFLRTMTVGSYAVVLPIYENDKLPQLKQKDAKMNSRLFTFIGGDIGQWKIVESKNIVGDKLPLARKLNIVNGAVSSLPGEALWQLRGVTSNERYVTRVEKEKLLARQAGLGRPEADCAALIPMRKNAQWWAMTQDERRKIFEEQSHHTVTGLKYLPAIARRLHHCRDLGEHEPFDFLTWFEFAKADTAAFDQLLVELRATPEWAFVDREVEIRLVRDAA
jgi:hypothetical protein